MIFTVLFWMMAAVVSLIGACGLIHLLWLYSDWPPVTGSVYDNAVDYRPVQSSAQNPEQNNEFKEFYHAKIRFVGRDRKTYLVTSKRARKEPFQTDENVRVWYNPLNPRAFKIIRPRLRLAFFSACLLGGGSVCSYLLPNLV